MCNMCYVLCAIQYVQCAMWAVPTAVCRGAWARATEHRITVQQHGDRASVRPHLCSTPARSCKVGKPDCASPRPAARPKDSHRLVPLDFERVTRGEAFSGFSARLGIDAAKACAAAAAVPNSFTNAGIHLGRVSPGCGL